MNIYDVYGLFDLEPIRGEGSYVYTRDGQRILDFYGGHAVISIGHSHPHFVKAIQKQAAKMVFYSNSVINTLQKQFCQLLGEITGIENYGLFFCNSGAEANENALKLASFYNQRTKVLCLEKGFHGRTSAAVNVTDNPNIVAPINKGFEVMQYHMDDIEKMIEVLRTETFCAVILEAIQGISGIHEVPDSNLQMLRDECEKTNTILIADEVQCGYGRSGDFFAFQQSGISPDIITMAKGMGNGFPIGGVLINQSKMPAKKSILGSTFGGNHLACTAGIAVLETIRDEQLMQNAQQEGSYLIDRLTAMQAVKEVRGRGLIIGIEFDFPIAELRKALLFEHQIFTGSSSNNQVLRILPPLGINRQESLAFIEALQKAIEHV